MSAGARGLWAIPDKRQRGRETQAPSEGLFI